MEQHAALSYIGPEAGDRYAVAGGEYRILLDGAATAGALTIIEMLVPPGGGPVPHRHPGFQETFLVLEGEVVMRSETGSFTATTGSTIHIPLNGAIHCFKNESAVPARLLCTAAPAGLDAMFRESGMPLKPGQSAPPPGKPDPAVLARMKALAESYGQELFPPDFLNAVPAQGKA